MTKYREIIRLTSHGFTQRNIMASCGVAQKTVVKVQHRAKELNLEWPLDDSMTDIALGKILFPKSSKSTTEKRMPDYAYIRKELLRNGVSKKLLWTEYMEDCRLNGNEPLMYSQFCYYIQQDEQKRRATMHINRKPGEQVEVDWAGDPAHVIDPDTGEIINAYVFVGVMTYSQYVYAEAFIDEKQPAWIRAHVHMYQFFGGVAKYTIKALKYFSKTQEYQYKYAAILSFCFQIFYLLYSLSGNCLYDMTFYLYIIAMAITGALNFRIGGLMYCAVMKARKRL